MILIPRADFDPDLYTAAGDLTEYITVITEFGPFMLQAKPWIADVNERYRAVTGQDLDAYPSQAWMSAWIAWDAIERAASTDRDAIRDALAATDISNPDHRALIMPYERIKFDETGLNTYAQLAWCQLQNGELIAVSPEEFREGDTIVPVPPWDER